MSIAKFSTYFSAILLLLAGVFSISAGIWMIARGSSGLAFVIAGGLVLFAGWYNIHTAKTKFPFIKVSSDNTIIAEWTLSNEEMGRYIANVKAKAKASAIRMAVFGTLFMFILGFLLPNLSLIKLLGFIMIIPAAVLISLIVQRARFKKWMAGDRKIVVKNFSINLFGNEVQLLSHGFWPESAIVLDNVSPLMIQIDLKYSRRYNRITQTYIPIPQNKLEEGWSIANHIGKIKSTHVTNQ